MQPSLVNNLTSKGHKSEGPSFSWRSPDGNAKGLGALVKFPAHASNTADGKLTRVRCKPESISIHTEPRSHNTPQ